MLGSVLTVAGAAAAVAAGYQSMSPTGQWYGRTFTGLAPGSRQLALTYDDGPNDPCTLRLLEILAKHNVRATFFLIGRYVRQRPNIVRALLEAGHAIGNHTFAHPNLIFATPGQTRSELQACAQAIQDAGATPSSLFRPPFGGRRPGTLRIARSMGLTPVMWNVAGRDWVAKSPEEIEVSIKRAVRGGDVILLHDGSHHGMGADRAHTVTATDRLITHFKASGYQFVTIPQMIEQAATSSR